MGLTGINDEFEASRRTFTSCDPNLTMAVGSDAGDCQDLGQEIDKLPFVQVARSGQVNGRFVGRKRLTGLGLKKRKADLRSGGPNEGSERLLLWTLRNGGLGNAKDDKRPLLLIDARIINAPLSILDAAIFG